MALSTPNVEITTDSFQNWLDKTNTLLFAYSTTILTASANSIGGFTTGNATVNGIFTANSLTVSGNSTFGLRGGNVVTANVLYITSNVSIGNASVNTVFTTTTLDTDLALTVLGATTLSNSLSVTGNSTLSSNVVMSGTLQTISGNVNIDSGVLFVDATNNRVGINNTAPTVELQVNGAANVSTSASIGTTLTVSGNATISGASHTVAGNTSFDSGVLFVDATNNRIGINNTTPGVALRVNGDVDISATANVQGNLNARANLAVNGSITINSTASFLTLANTNLGSNVTANLVAVSFPLASYTGGEILLHVVNATERQTTKLIFAHNGTDVNQTIYGTIVAPSSSQELANNIVATVNATNIDVTMRQRIASSSVKILANLF